jgi:hypothetical protein
MIPANRLTWRRQQQTVAAAVVVDRLTPPPSRPVLAESRPEGHREKADHVDSSNRRHEQPHQLCNFFVDALNVAAACAIVVATTLQQWTWKHCFRLFFSWLHLVMVYSCPAFRALRAFAVGGFVAVLNVAAASAAVVATTLQQWTWKDCLRLFFSWLHVVMVYSYYAIRLLRAFNVVVQLVSVYVYIAYKRPGGQQKRRLYSHSFPKRTWNECLHLFFSCLNLVMEYSCSEFHAFNVFVLLLNMLLSIPPP